MRVIYLHQYFNTPRNACGLRSYEMARRLVAKGHEVHIITSSRGNEDVKSGWTTTNESGIIVHWVAEPYANTMSYARRIWAFTSFAIRASVRAITLKGDIVVATSTPLTIGIPGMIASFWHRIPLVFEVRDLWPAVPIAIGAIKSPFLIWAARKLERLIYRRSRAVIALSAGMRDGVIQQGMPAESVYVIPNASDLARFSVPAEEGRMFRAKYDWLRERPLVLYIGTIGRINGLSYMVRLAAVTWKVDRECRFLVVGSGVEEKEIRKLAEELGVLGKNFFMFERIPKGRIAGILSAATIATSFVIDVPETWSNSANKFFDSLAAGRPIAINYQGWQADLLRRTGSGIVLDPHSIENAANDLIKFITNGEAISEAGKAARSLGESEFNIDTLAARFAAVLEDAQLSGKSASVLKVES